MLRQRSSCNGAEYLLIQRDANIPARCGLPPGKKCSECANLVQNPSFETDLTAWVTDNVIVADAEPFEGTQVARLGPGVASMFQDVALTSLIHSPLFLSFYVFAGTNNDPNGNLVVEVLWLDVDRNVIAAGLRVFIPNGRINSRGRITYFDVTDLPPAGAAWARLQFSKGSGASPDLIEIDQVILAAVGTINLIQNPGFEAGLTSWTATTFSLDFSESLEGGARVLTNSDGSTLFQDIPISKFPAGSSFLLGFGASAIDIANLSVQVRWLNSVGIQIGLPGLNLVIPRLTLSDQGNYLTYLDVTGPAPFGAVKARILFTATDVDSDSDNSIDQVIFARTATTNLVLNPSFENGLTDWTLVNTAAVASTDAYEGNTVAQMGEPGGVLFQNVTLPNAAGHCFLFNCGIGYGGGIFPDGNILIKLLWLDASGREIGLGLSLVDTFSNIDQWVVYTGITEPAPLGTTGVRIQFTKSEGATGGTIDVDKVVLVRLV